MGLGDDEDESERSMPRFPKAKGGNGSRDPFLRPQLLEAVDEVMSEYDPPATPLIQSRQSSCSSLQRSTIYARLWNIAALTRFTI